MIAEIGGKGHEESGENVLYQTREYLWKLLPMSPIIENTELKVGNDSKNP